MTGWEAFDEHVRSTLARLRALQAALRRSAAEEPPGAPTRSRVASARLLELYDLAATEQAWAAELPPTSDVAHGIDRIAYRSNMLRVQYAVGAFIGGTDNLAFVVDDVIGAFHCDDPTCCPPKPASPQRATAYDA